MIRLEATPHAENRLDVGLGVGIQFITQAPDVRGSDVAAGTQNLH